MFFINFIFKRAANAYTLNLMCIGTIGMLAVGCKKNSFVKTKEPVLNTRPSDGELIITALEKFPEFPGGTKKMFEFFIENIKRPERALKARVSGRVFLSFFVEKDGEISNIEIVKSLGFGCDEEAIRVVSSFPKWEPGLQSGMPVRVKYNLPINFPM